MQQRKKIQQLVLVGMSAISLWGLSGCDQAKPTAYKIPKEERSVSMPMPGAQAASSAETASQTAPASPATAPAAPGMQVLPGMSEAAQQAGEIIYSTPAGWTDLPASGIRKAHLRVTDENGSAELTVTTFPGDVGGTLANINRWRGQIQLPAIQADQLGEVTRQTSIFHHGALYVTLDGGVDSIIAAILPFHGYTWFIKLQGSSSTVFDNEAKFQQFLDSFEIAGHSH